MTMSKKKKSYNPREQYFSAINLYTVGKNEHYGQIYPSMMKSDRFKSLTNVEKLLLFTCIAEASSEEGRRCLYRHGEAEGKHYDPNQFFVFPNSHMVSFGLEPRNSRKSLKVLIQNGFVEKVEDNHCRRLVNVYKFSTNWKNKDWKYEEKKVTEPDSDNTS